MHIAVRPWPASARSPRQIRPTDVRDRRIGWSGSRRVFEYSTPSGTGIQGAVISYHERPVPGVPVVACSWGQTAPNTPGAFTRVVPDGCIDLIWSRVSGRIQVAGPDTGPMLAALAPGDRYAGVRFRPGTAPATLGVPADALRDARVDLAELWGAAAVRMADSVAVAADPEAALLHAVLARVHTAAPVDPIAPAVLATVSGLAASEFADAAAPVSVAAMAREFDVSERQLRRRCCTAFGYGPKTLQRVLRFQRALALARGGTEFAAAAHAAGYADQAHLAREVRDLAGVPLGRLVG